MDIGTHQTRNTSIGSMALASDDYLLQVGRVRGAGYTLK
jgi:hypothetical protein